MRKLILLFSASLICQAQGYFPGGGSGGGGGTGPTGPGYTATSATSLTVSAGSKTLTTQPGLAYAVGSCLILVSRGTPTGYMIGLITAYTGSSLTFTATAISASSCSGIGSGGPFTDWNLSVSGLVGANGSAGASGSNGTNGATGATGPTGTVGTLDQVSSNTVVACADFNGNTNFQSTATLVFQLPTGCTAPGWATFMSNSTGAPTFNLSTNSVTVNGSSTFNPTLTGTGTAGYPRVVLTIDPSSSTNYIASFAGPSTGGGGTPGGSSGQVQYNNAGSFGGFTASGDFTLVPSTGVATLATVNTNTGACGDSTHVCQITLNGKGLATAATPVAVSGGGGGALTQICESAGTFGAVTGTTTETNIATCSIPSGTLSANSRIYIYTNWKFTGVAGAKTPVTKLSTTSGSVSGSDMIISLNGTSATTIDIALISSFYMSNSTAVEESSGVGYGSNNTTGGVISAAINAATTNMFINLNCFLANSADSCQLRHYTVMYGN